MEIDERPATTWRLFSTKGTVPHLADLAEEIGACEEQEQLGFAKAWLNTVKGKKDLQMQLLDLVARVVLEGNYGRIEELLEGFLTKHPEMTPSRAAYLVRRQLSLPAKMRPLTISIARRIKNRNRQRKIRERRSA